MARIIKLETASVDGQEVRIGSTVGFKCDVEQHGEIIAIEKNLDALGWNGVELTLSNKHGFSGDYIGGSKLTKVWAEDCWL